MRNLIENHLEELGIAIIKIDNNYMVVKDAEVVYYCGEDYSSCLRYIHDVLLEGKWHWRDKNGLGKCINNLANYTNDI